MKETDIRKGLQAYLRLKGWFVYYNLAGLGAYPGLSDLVAIKDGRVIHVEVKTPAGRQSEKQLTFERDIKRCGGEYIVARCIEDLQEAGM